MPATKQYRSRRRTWLSGLALIVPALLVVGLVPTGAALADDGDAIAQWDFTTGSATDVSWNGSDGTAGSGVSFDTTNGATFDGTDNGEITVGYNSLHDYRPDAAGADGTWRMELDGVTPSAVGPDYRTIVGSRSNDNGWAVYVTNQKKLEFWMAQNSGSTTYATAKSGVTAAVGGTYDIVVEKTGSQISISVTGSASGSGTATLGGGYKAVGTDAPLRFGNGGNAGNQYFFKGSVKSATVNVDESDGGQPPTTPPVTVPKPVYPLPDSTYEQAAHDVLARAIGTAADQVAFTLARSTDGIEKYTIGGTSGHIDITATTPSALTAGAGWYLKYVVHAAVNLGQPNPVVPATLPAPAQAITNTAHEGYRYALNDTNEGYTDPYLDWNGWQQFLDNLALHGINQVFVSVGTDAVYEKLLQKYGYSADEARAWIPQPAHQPWWVLQNISSDGQDAMTQTLLDERAQLAHQIVDYANDLGITPVIPGYFGTVPTDFAQRNPGANVVAQGTWSGYERPSWLDPTSTLFDKVAADYYSISSQLIGDAGAYKMDPLHEGGKSGNISVSGAATGIEKALRLAHPNAIWVLLGWQSDPSTTLLSGIKDKSRILIVDGLADTRTTLDDESRWPGFPYAFGTIYNFGGNTSIGALTTVWLDRYFAARAKAGSALQGISILPEGFYNNPAAFELMSELPWMDKAPDQTQWFHDYALGRYGTNAAADAWTTIADTVYSMDPIGTHSESQDSLFDAQPSLTTTKARSCCSVGQVRYDFPTFATALPKLISASPSVVQHAAYDYDLTDVTRQVIANTSRDLLPKINTAYQAGDVDEFDSLTASWIALMKQQDAVLATNSDFLLGTYDDHAAAQNGDVGVYDLQNLLTTWGTKASFSLHDYANREWQGLVGDLYVSRWQQYFASLRTAMVKGGSPASIDWYSVDEAWAKADHHYADKPSGDIVVEAGKAVKMLDQGTVSLSLSASTIRPGSAGTVTATVQNTSPLGDVDTVDVSLATPDGLSATATSDTKLTDIAAGEKRTVTWNVTADPDQVAGVVSTLTATAQVNAGGEEDTKTATSTVLVGTEPAAPWKTYTTETSPTFAQAGGQIGIETTGNDFSKTTRRFSAVYQQSTMSVGETAIVHVDVQDSQATRPYARSGIAVSSDMTAADSPMVLLSLTPLNGCVLTWNGTSSGSLDTHLYARELSGPMWLRLTRTADGFEGACSTDGESWTTLGTAKPAGMSDEPDAGLLASAVNSGGTDAVLAAFSQWSVRDGQEGDLKLSSSTVKAGTDVQATGSTFPSSANVTLSLRGQDDDATPIALGTATTDRDGGFTSSLSIPDSVVAGDYTVVASGAGVTATAPLKVTAADKPSATVTVSPSAVSAAQLADPGVVVTGANFPSNGDVALSIDGAAAGSEPAAADGSVTIPFRSTSLRAGTHTVRLSAGNVSAEAQLVVLPDPVVTLSTSSVKAGGVVTVTGEHFPASVTATIELHSDPVTLSKLSTDSNGSFSVSVTVPKDAPTGKHEIVVTAGTITAEAAITVTDGGAGAGTNPGSGTGGTKHDSDGGLASTGVDFPFWLLLAGIGLMLLGGSAFVVRRRRNG